jgi:hypothetical protein
MVHIEDIESSDFYQENLRKARFLELACVPVFRYE